MLRSATSLTAAAAAPAAVAPHDRFPKQTAEIAKSYQCTGCGSAGEGGAVPAVRLRMRV